MTSYKNFSLRNRAEKDSHYSNNPERVESRRVNQKQIEDFQKNKEKWRELCSYFRWYPDKFIDFIAPDNALIKLYFYQRVYLRIIFRYRKVFITATRGTSKSFLVNLAFLLLCIMYPRSKWFCCAPGKEQAARITQECLNDIFEFWPILRKEIRTFNEEKDYTRIITHSNSRYDVVQMTDATRGGRREGGAIEEIGDKKFDGTILNSVVIPLMANSRIAMCGKVDPREIHKREVYVTTASSQQQFAYEKCMEIRDDMLSGESAFCIGNSYDLPCIYGQLDLDFVEEKRSSPTFSILDFMREYESIYTGSSTNSLVADDKLAKARKVGEAEWEHSGESGVEYVLAYDVARTTGRESALCALVVIKITPKEDGSFIKQVVNVFSLEGMHDTWQALYLKQKVDEFKAKILVVDSNGLGSGVIDQLVLELEDGHPGYKVVNDKDGMYNKYLTDNSIPILFAMDSRRKETKNVDMTNHIMKLLNKGEIELLMNPHEGIKYLQKKRRKNFTEDSEELAEAQIPYILTNNLVEEIMNLEYKTRGNDSEVTQVSPNIPKDKYEALKYGLYWIYLHERKNKRTITSGIKDMKERFVRKRPNIRKY